jgi:hypothetical protein
VVPCHDEKLTKKGLAVIIAAGFDGDRYQDIYLGFVSEEQLVLLQRVVSNAIAINK